MSKIGNAVEVNMKKISCEGGANAAGHPRVFLNMGDNNEVVCPYCSKKFIIRENKAS